MSNPLESYMLSLRTLIKAHWRVSLVVGKQQAGQCQLGRLDLGEGSQGEEEVARNQLHVVGIKDRGLQSRAASEIGQGKIKYGVGTF